MCKLLLTIAIAAASAFAQGWQKGKGYGWVFGSGDERGAINTVNTPAKILVALKGVKTGRTFDMGVPVDRLSYKWPGHSPTEVLSYRSPEGAKRAPDTNPFKGHPAQMAWHSCALFISDNVGTQIDGLGHITSGADNHWYNGFKEADYGTDFGVRKADADPCG